jgi:hypothetical protein
VSGEPGRICGKRKCITAGHKKASGVEPGWYITATPKCYWAFPCLPTESDGGPITSDGAALLYQDPDPLKMTKGQWRVVIESWLDAAQHVATVDSEEQDRDTDGPNHFHFGKNTAEEFDDGPDDRVDDDEQDVFDKGAFEHDPHEAASDFRESAALRAGLGSLPAGGVDMLRQVAQKIDD